MINDRLKFKTYLLSGDAFEAAKQYNDVFTIFANEINEIDEEATAKKKESEKKASLKAREFWNRILFSYPFDPIETYGDPCLMVDTSYVEEHNLAFLIHREILDKKGKPVKIEKMELPAIKRFN